MMIAVAGQKVKQPFTTTAQLHPKITQYSLPGKVATQKVLQHYRTLSRPLTENKVKACSVLIVDITGFLTEVRLP